MGNDFASGGKHNALVTEHPPWASSHDAQRVLHVAARHLSNRPSVRSYLQKFVEVLNVTFLRLPGRDLCLFEMDVLIVKCLQEQRNRSQCYAEGLLIGKWIIPINVASSSANTEFFFAWVNLPLSLFIC